MSLLQTFQLFMKSGPAPEKVFALSQTEVYIGRDISNDVVINDAEISRKHARLVLQSGQYLVEDLGSTNGTFVNRVRLTGPQVLRAGDIIHVGENVSLEFQVIQMDPDATVAMAKPELDLPGMSTAPDVRPIQDTTPPPQKPAYTPAPAPTPAPTPTPQPEPQPVYVPPAQDPSPVYEAPSYQQAPVYVPSQPSAPQKSKPASSTAAPSTPKAPKKSNQRLYIILGIILLLFFVCCLVPGIFLWWVDSQGMWCEVMPFLPGCPVP